MGILLLLFGLGVLCTLLWTCAVYALPLYAGFAAGFWALGHGAGVGSGLVGIVAGVALLVTGRYAALSSNYTARWLAVAAFVLPAAFAGYSMVTQLSEAIVPSPVWRIMFGIAGGIAVGATTIARLTRDQEGA